MSASATAADAQGKIRWATDRFLAVLSGAAEPAWQYRPPTGKWSMSEVTEHVAVANKGVLSLLSKRLTSPLDGPLALEDDEIPFLFYGGGEPPPAQPLTGAWTDRAQACEMLDASAQSMIEWASRTDLDLRACGCEHPVFGLMDGVQWLLFVYAHTARHRAELLDLERSTALSGS